MLFITMASSFNYPKSARLLKTKEYLFAQRQGKKFYSEDLCLQILQTQARRDARLGLTVSRKYGHSVVRNLFKRRLKEIFRHCRTHLATGLIIHIRPLGKAQHPCQVPSYAALKEQWDRVLNSQTLYAVAPPARNTQEGR